ncbi:MAG: hypothetical protein NTU73_05315, partial [Ignavibacteriae bacterium]|nr:hypothetical protein [Ignavibacteriota bacterium]
MKNLALLILLVLSISLKAQLSEKFTDGNFNNNPVWFGDTCSFKITSSTAIPSVMRPGLQMYNTIAGNSYIVTSNPLILSDDEWDFWIKLSFNPSENNNAKAYIVSDQSDLKGALNGYYIGIGETNDKITFCKQTGLTSSILCSGINANLDKSNNPIRIHIKRSINALWQIYSDTLGGSNFILEGSVIDNTFSAGTYFGFSCLYTSTDADKFYFDDVYAGEIIVDTIAPKLVLINTPSPNKIDVLFSESVDQITSTDIYNYYVTNGVSYPISVQQDAANKCLVHLN